MLRELTFPFRRIKRAAQVLFAPPGPRKLSPWAQLESLPSVMTLVDIGVGRGTPRLYAAQPQSDLVLIDPLKESRQAVKENEQAAGLAGRSYRFEVCALGGEAGEANLVVEDDIELSSLLTRTALTQTKGAKQERKVPLRRLDELFQEGEWKTPLGLKIDTEGFELEVLKGAEQALSQTAFVVVELSIARRFEGSYRAEEVILFLAERGFTLHGVMDAPYDEQGVVRFIDAIFLRKQPLDEAPA